MIEEEMNKIAIHTHVIFRSRNAMFFFYWKRTSFRIVNDDVIVILYG